MITVDFIGDDAPLVEHIRLIQTDDKDWVLENFLTMEKDIVAKIVCGDGILYVYSDKSYQQECPLCFWEEHDFELDEFLEYIEDIDEN